MPATSRKIHGRNSRLYVGLLSDTAAATPVVFQTKWTMAFNVDKLDVTALGDTNKQSVAGLPGATGTFDGWYDTGSDQLFTAAQDGLARRFYLYPTTVDGTYWFGTAFFDFNVAGGVEEAVAVSGTFEAASNVQKVSAP